MRAPNASPSLYNEDLAPAVERRWGTFSICGPLLGAILADYYLIARGDVNVNALYQEHGEYRYQGGFNVRAFLALGTRPTTQPAT
jgi:cytosine/uracil/thiamine/allantoin permease